MKRILKQMLLYWINEIKYYEDLGYYVTRLDDLSKVEWGVFTKEFKEGDKVYWLGHDGVYGCLFGCIYEADKEMVEKKNDISFWKCIKKIKV